MNTPSDILVLAPIGRDAAMVTDVLIGAGMRAHAPESMAQVCAAMAAGAGALIVAEEAFDADAFQMLAHALDAQEPWSDLPIVLLAGNQFTDSADRATRVLAPLRNVMVLERPIRLSVLVTALQVALRARHRQYELRDLLARREQDALDRARALESEQKARREAEAANRLKDEFLATVSHELRTPVNVILGWSGMLRRDHSKATQRAHAIDVIHRNARAQARVIDELLDISRIISGKLRMDVDRVELRSVLADAVDAVRPAVDAKQISLETHCHGAPLVFGDVDRLRQVFFNLLTNAVKFTPEAGSIRVEASARNGQAEVRVTDTGIGIPQEVLPFVFERFRQADSTTTRAYGGLGLGLAIVRQLVELHGGTVDAISDGANAGSTFIVRLSTTQRPPRESGVSRIGAQARDEEPLPRLDGVNLLVVDDDPDGREMIVELLEGLGGRVTSSDSGSSALAMFAEVHPDVVVADIAMPGLDGYALIQQLRDTVGAAMPRAIALSAYAREEDRARAYQAGFDAHVAKPVDALVLVRTIRNLVSTTAAGATPLIR
jgi:signal transduction histidine kinase/CheY-like chemotaxis protein